ncbi:hypothetical protein ACQP0I_04085 [Micromonospora carbonacea]|uniref:hypothetical protein n=1 Tax=Micromonospora carbonacea TaxID=47853 RepID=UPI003D980C24
MGAVLVRACAGTHLARLARHLPRATIAGYRLGRQVIGGSDCHSVAYPANGSGTAADARR